MFNVFALSEYDREIAIAEKVYDIAMSEVHYMEAMIDSKLKINLAKSELKVMQESSEENYVGDLAYLFNEAAKESEEQNKSFFSKAKQAVVNFFVSLWNAIQKLFTGKNTAKYDELKGIQETITVDGDLDGIEKACNAVATALESGVAAEEDDKKFGTAAKILGITAGAVGTGLILTKVAKKLTELKDGKTTDTPSKIEQLKESISKHVKRFADALPKIPENEKTQAFFAPLRTIGTVMSSVIGTTNNAIDQVLAKFGKGGNTNNDSKPNIDYAVKKSGLKNDLYAVAKNLGAVEGFSRNNFKIDDIKKVVKLIEEKIAAGKCQNLVNKLPAYKGLIAWMDANNVTEFTLDFSEGEMFTESEYSEYAEYAELFE